MKCQAPQASRRPTCLPVLVLEQGEVRSAEPVVVLTLDAHPLEGVLVAGPPSLDALAYLLAVGSQPQVSAQGGHLSRSAEPVVQFRQEPRPSLVGVDRVATYVAPRQSPTRTRVQPPLAALLAGSEVLPVRGSV